MEETIFTYYVDLPTTIRSFVVSKYDMSLKIILNAKLGREQLLKAYLHEMDHIRNGDYDKKCSVNLIETAAHGI